LGHLSFGYLKKLQPYLFNVVHDSEFHCNICEMAKSHCITYLPSLNKISEPFAVIHSDVWGPVKSLPYQKLVILSHLLMNVLE
jgi:hypothetical protein